ncbi:transcriptional attenuator, LytR family [Rathayibacter oskolensis]|uniref:Transcriptional attenuator, LytR family n=1 Tax=Rathayibacter oskolensis TaxID=1891671 RepID=A0A1X7NVN8_9MICO|nr:LCP family protein [Rathayibacter oskolensis]SMH42196.1 transcriptional attenuator, LytR family [Rathayibacter oskolensis]
MTTTALPMRYPDSGSSAVMTRRGWWLLVLAVVLPGSAQVLAGSRRLGRLGVAATLALWAALALLAGAALVLPTALLTLLTSDVPLLVLQALLVFYGLLWAILTLDTLRLVCLIRVGPTARPLIAAAAALAIVLSAGSTGYTAHLVGVSRGLLSTVFGDSAAVAPVDGRSTVLLLGGDAGEDRDGLRPDSISVVSIDEQTGEAVVIGLPRDLQKFPFPADSPLAELYPDGYPAEDCAVDTCQLNSVYTEVQLKEPELYPDAEARGSSPGIEGMRDAVSGVLGVPVQYFVLIDMQGFADLIDALGGVDITYTGSEDLPFGGVLDEEGRLQGVNAWLTPGAHHLDGSNALAYARSRYGSGGGDYDRMLRQREVQNAILERLDPLNVLARFPALARTASSVLTTDVPRGALGSLLALALRASAQPVGTLELVPPLVIPSDPDYDAIRADVAALLSGAR